MKEELKSIFGKEINDFSRKNNQPNNDYKHSKFHTHQVLKKEIQVDITTLTRQI